METNRTVLVEHHNNVNSIIKTPLQATQRIKFTCFDISQNYIVFGATSGGLYVYNRFPCEFIKLIPNKHGSVSRVSVSSNQKTIALATLKGLVVIVENCQTEGNFQYQVYSEHYGSLVTALQWHMNDLYCGDNKGKVSVISMPNLLSKAIFQVPCTSIMQLDSSIVQIDCYSKYLVVSSLTKSYLCDTEKEQFRQIGKKLRDGHFGACFFISSGITEETPTQTPPPSSIGRGKFFRNTTRDQQQFTVTTTDDIKIFCSRPGVRMWEARLDASVVRTHQFKNSLMHESFDIAQLDDSVNGHLKILSSDHIKTDSDCFNFGKVTTFMGKFIFTFNKHGFYVFEPETLRVVCWNNKFGKIEDAKIFNNFIYIWSTRDDGESPEITLVALYDLEKLILKTLFNKQYYICGELCLNYLEDVVNLIRTSKKIHMISILKEKLSELSMKQLLGKLEPLFEALQQEYDAKFSSQTLATGIVVVNNPYYELTCEAQTLNDNRTEFQENSPEIEEKIEPNPDTILKIFHQQYEWSKLNKNVEMSKFTKILTSNPITVNIKLFQDFSDLTTETHEAKLWSHRHFFKYLSKLNFQDEIARLENEGTVLSFLLEAFYSINHSPEQQGCPVCFYPLPWTRKKTAQYYQVGCEIMKKVRDTKLAEEMKKNVPYMWKHVIEEMCTNEDINLQLLVQFGDKTLMRKILKEFKYDTWDSAVQLLIKLKKQICLNCDSSFRNVGNNNCDSLSWSSLGTLMVQSIGGSGAIKLLLRYADFIPPGELDSNFYQTCILMSTNEDVAAVKLIDALQTDTATEFQLNESIVKYLQRGHLLKPKDSAKSYLCSIRMQLKEEML